jgi:hypothetical protein
VIAATPGEWLAKHVTKGDKVVIARHRAVPVPVRAPARVGEQRVAPV